MESDSPRALCADLYYALAEAFAPDGPPEWLARPGREWPLFEAVVRLGQHSEAARRAAEVIAQIGAESQAVRRARYAALFAGAGRPRFWLYESAHRSGRLLGPESFAVERFYRTAGLAIVGAELPDHASLELAFLAFLAERQADDVERADERERVERRFIANHAGRWLSDLGRALAHSEDVVYAPIGQLLADWLAESAHPHRRVATPSFRLPVILQAESCTLCGFCVQVCPTRALAIRETPTESALVLSAGACVGCAKCERLCEPGALKMRQLPASQGPAGGRRVLCKSLRAHCPGCGQPTVSEAELAYVAKQIGHLAWLDYCLECRSWLREEHP
jgi:TorA maturation chaperone TorD/formate hydrogenlyase subunit 6/NADH:ubiquinone oxidoreductase subunit I